MPSLKILFLNMFKHKIAFSAINLFTGTLPVVIKKVIDIPRMTAAIQEMSHD